MLRTRFSDAEWEALQGLSTSAGMSMSELVRDHLGALTVLERDEELEKKRIALLNRINANLNMIAKWVNTRKDSADAIEVIGHLVAIERAVKAAK